MKHAEKKSDAGASSYQFRHKSKLLGEFEWEGVGGESGKTCVCVVIALFILIAGLVTHAPFYAILLPLLGVVVFYVLIRQRLHA